MINNEDSLKEILKLDKLYILFGGTIGSGKSTFAKKYFSKFPIIDPDEIALQLSNYNVNEVLKFSSKALHEKQKIVKKMLNDGLSFVEMGTSANIDSAIKKIVNAKLLGYTTIFVFIDTNPKESSKRNSERIRSGQRGISKEKENKIELVYNSVIKTYNKLLNDTNLDFMVNFGQK